MSDFAAEHIVEAQKPVGEAAIYLFEIQLRGGGFLYFKNNETKTWQGKTYSGTVVNLTGVETTAEAKDNKPKLQVANKSALADSIFSSFVAAGVLEKSKVIRHRVLRPHLESDTNIKQQRSWFITRVTSLTAEFITMELRNLSEGPNFLVPPRRFEPPLFPIIQLR